MPVTGAEARPVTVSAKPIALDPSDAGIIAVGRLEFLAGFELSTGDTDWGGLSGAAVTADGSLLAAVSDIGLWYRIPLLHDAAGRLTGIGAVESLPLLDRDGKPLMGKGDADAEAVTVTPDGSLIVAFERRHRLWRYGPEGDPLLSPARPFRGPNLSYMPANTGIEAMTQLSDGRMLLFSEGSFSRAGDVRGWLLRDKQWSEVGLVPDGTFRPSDMAALPNSDVLLLERRVDMLRGFGARLSIIDGASLIPLARLRSREIAILEYPLSVDNFEALAVRQAADGTTLIYLLSDDNRSMFQRTLLLQFRLQS